jgi:hypothetical protein
LSPSFHAFVESLKIPPRGQFQPRLLLGRQLAAPVDFRELHFRLGLQPSPAGRRVRRAGKNPLIEIQVEVVALIGSLRQGIHFDDLIVPPLSPHG